MLNNAVPIPVDVELSAHGESRLKVKSLDREIFALAMPVFFGQGITASAGLIGRVIASRLGTKAFNGINVGMMVFMLIITIISAVGVGSMTLVAQTWGGGDQKRSNEIMQQSLVAGIILSVVIMLFGLSVRKLLFDFLGTDAQTAMLGAEYLFWFFIGVPFIAPGFFLASCLRGTGDTKTPMFAAMVMALLTLLLSYALIMGKFGMPRLETMGAALAIDLAFFVYTAILAVTILFKKTNLNFQRNGWWPDMVICRSLFKIGMPSAAEWMLVQLGVIIYVPVVTHYGNDALAGFFAGMALPAVVQSMVLGFQTATNSLVGQMIGANNLSKAEDVFRRSAFLAMITMAVLGAISFCFALSPLFTIFFEDLNPDSLAYGRLLVFLLALAMPLMGISFSMAGGLRGSGNSMLPLIASTIGVYLGRVAVAFAVYHLFHPPIYVVWCSMFPDLIARIAIMAMGIKSGRWKNMKLKL